MERNINFKISELSYIYPIFADKIHLFHLKEFSKKKNPQDLFGVFTANGKTLTSSEALMPEISILRWCIFLQHLNSYRLSNIILIQCFIFHKRFKNNKNALQNEIAPLCLQQPFLFFSKSLWYPFCFPLSRLIIRTLDEKRLCLHNGITWCGYMTHHWNGVILRLNLLNLSLEKRAVDLKSLSFNLEEVH